MSALLVRFQGQADMHCRVAGTIPVADDPKRSSPPSIWERGPGA
jgi:hypothetical protein